MIAWLEKSNKYIGFSELKNGAQIKLWVKEMGPAWFASSFMPESDTGGWAGVFVARCLRDAGLTKLPESYMNAAAWSVYGLGVKEPIPGCIAIIPRIGGYHVGFVTGKTAAGDIIVRGGNQNNIVCDVKFAKSQILGYRWPAEAKTPVEALQVVNLVTAGPLSTI